MDISRFTLGTAQLGFDYGIANQKGKPDKDEAFEILSAALDGGCRSLDTSAAYGDAEETIGTFLSKKGIPLKGLTIITKLPNLRIPEGKRIEYSRLYETMKKHVVTSLKNLGLDVIPVYFLHSYEELQARDGMVLDILLKLKKEGLFKVLGVSVYYPQDVRDAMAIKELGAVQVPVNLFDHRFIEPAKACRKKGMIVLGRSVFLQGLFFLNPEDLPPRLGIARGPLFRLKEFLSAEDIDTVGLALGFVRGLEDITSLVVGAETRNQVLENIKRFESVVVPEQLKNRIMEAFAGLSEKLLNPSLW